VNRCRICGRFRPWAWLVPRYHVEIASEYGGLQEDEWFECQPGKGCAPMTEWVDQDEYDPVEVEDA